MEEMMSRSLFTQLLGLFAVLTILIIPCVSYSEILFEDNFDSHPDWSPAQPKGLSSLCYNNCSSAPEGYDGYRVGWTFYNDPGHNTLNIDSSQHRGPSGKAFIFWNESDPSEAWENDGMLFLVLGVPRSELYVRFYIKFQPGWKWRTGESAGQKFFRITHWPAGTDPSKFGTSGTQRPLTTLLLFKQNSGKANVKLVNNFRYEVNYKAHSNSEVYLADGNYEGTGSAFDKAGNLGDGAWHCIEVQAKMNSAVGVADGVVRTWLDGVKISETTDLAFSDAGSETNPRHLWNWIALGGNTINHYAPLSDKSEQWYAIDDLVVSTEYIGPDYVIGSGVPSDRISPATPLGTTAHVNR